VSTTAQAPALLEVYVEAVRLATDVPPPRATQHRARSVIAELLEEGYDQATVELACRLAGEKAEHPLGIADAVPRASQLMRDVRDLPSPSEALARARAYVAESGWPSGVRWVYSGISGTYVLDVLGRDQAGYEVPGAHRPTLSEIARALESASA
jgi:hypothetical protein